MFMVADAPPMLDASASLPADPPAIVEPASGKPATEQPAAVQLTPVVPPGYILVPAPAQPQPSGQYILAPANQIPTAKTPPALPGTDLTHDAIGMGVSWISGSGIIYRHYDKSEFGYQVAGIPWVTGQWTLFNVGAQVMQRIMTRDQVSMHWLLGFGYAYMKNNWLTDWQQQSEHVDLGIAPGVGIDYSLGKNWWVTGALSYTFGAQWGLDKSGNVSKPTNGRGTPLQDWFWNFTPGLGAGILYAW